MTPRPLKAPEEPPEDYYEAGECPEDDSDLEYTYREQEDQGNFYD